MKYQITSQPAVEPISLTEAKDHLRIDGTDEDTYLATIITAARKYCEQYCNRAFITQTWKQYPDDFSDGMKLSINPVQSVTSITYYDEDGNYHRKDGPAIIYPSGKCYCYVNGHNVSSWFEDRGLNIEDMTDDDWAIFELEMKFVFKGK